MQGISQDQSSCPTRLAVIWQSILNEPLVSLYALFPFILYRELHASTFQLAVFFMVKPVVSVFSLYWASKVSHQRSKLISNVIWGGVFSRLPFFAFPFIANAWSLIALGAIYWLFLRGMIPAWMEILKLNLPKTKRGHVYSYGAILGFAEGVALAIAIGPILDMNAQAWRWLFPVAATFGMASVFFQTRITIKEMDTSLPVDMPNTVKDKVLRPWHECMKLVGRRPDFACFQWGVMLCGFALMLMKPVEPVIFELLGLTYTDLAVAVLICKGLGYILTSNLWARWMNEVNIYVFTSLIFTFWALSYFFLMTSLFAVYSLYVAYFIYGVCLAGNHLSWNLAGPIFAKDDDSSLFTSFSVAMVGIRGLIGPSLGSLLLAYFVPSLCLSIGIFLCIYSAFKMLRWGKRYCSCSNEPLID